MWVGPSKEHSQAGVRQRGDRGEGSRWVDKEATP